MEKPSITNTAKLPATKHLEDAMVLGTSQAITASESHGQIELVHSEQLPSDNRDKELMEKWGLVFGESCADDPIFVKATLPEGWKKVPTEHAMWSHLVDEHGRTRAAIFYKAAFYDRSAHISATRRFSVRKDYDWQPPKEDVKGSLKYIVICDDKVLMSNIRSYEGEEYGEDWRTTGDLLEKSCQLWLDEKYPDHKDAVKSWEIEVDFPEQ